MSARSLALASPYAERNWDSLQFRFIFALSFVFHLAAAAGSRLSPSYWAGAPAFRRSSWGRPSRRPGPRRRSPSTADGLTANRFVRFAGRESRRGGLRLDNPAAWTIAVTAFGPPNWRVTWLKSGTRCLYIRHD